MVEYVVSTPLLSRSLTPLGSNTEERMENEAVAIDSCVQPPTSTLNVCNNLNYLIPESLAKISSAIEMEIGALADDQALYRSDGCMAVATEIMCAQRFPECREKEDGEIEVLLTSLDCQRILEENCDMAVSGVLLGDRNFCDLQNSSQPADDCKKIGERESEADTQMQYCGLDSQREVTSWMYELIRYYDTRLARIASSSSCFQQQANFTCQLLGQCSADGQRLEIVNTYEACESFINW